MDVLPTIKNLIWSAPLLLFFLGTGCYLTWILRGVQFRYLGYALRQVFAEQKKSSKGDISHFEALMTSLAGAIGTGNIVGVATAVTIGGMGSLFWMTVTAFIGMAIKFAESLLAVKYRVTDDRGEMLGGPMQYMEHGLGWRAAAVLFALFGSLAAIGTGNLVQINAIAESVSIIGDVDQLYVGLAVMVLLALATIGGVKSIGHTAGVLVPLMATFYIVGSLVIIGLHIDRIPHALYMIITSAFSPQAATGGFAGATVMMAIRMGVARSIFSNEAGLGISSIAAAAAKTDAPCRQALITMTGCLVSTVFICTLTGLVLAVTDTFGAVDANGVAVQGAALSLMAFGSSLAGGTYIVTIGLILFAFSTIVAWAYYGEKCFEYLFGTRCVLAYRIFYVLLVVPGAILKIDTVWHIADIMNGLMVLPNLAALLALSGVVKEETRLFLVQLARESVAEEQVV